jgi:hypothetical protein
MRHSGVVRAWDAVRVSGASLARGRRAMRGVDDMVSSSSHIPLPLPSPLDRLLRAVHRWIWADPWRRAGKLLRFAETEERGSRDLCRAAESTNDALLRRLLLRHASDEQRHADVFRARGRRIFHDLGYGRGGAIEANWLAPGERGLDALEIDGARTDDLLAFLHLSEKAAAGRFVLYREVLDGDPLTRAAFEDVLRDEVFHMRYTRTQLARIAPRNHGLKLWQARARRVWRAYLRIAVALASALGTLLLYAQYFALLPVFAWIARRTSRNETAGWKNVRAARPFWSQY